ncbi:hypothetical protein HYH03_009452 [Edaphochlamys debaryana]|uniref:Uncharacterized protein n=1 Tax=Edaphochlamys debaryana TaxID=47281 RepID=A0A836BWZ9_9CHLO|nr:hypothetical protein HYH03_009452 [Edaphochlamys debaryana]|eukprot:KAG2492206.1 hypothetical protein HYH03_009452 [Edaphochlamys debaryana]
MSSGGGMRGSSPPFARADSVRRKCGTQGVAKLVQATTRLYIGVGQVREWLGEVEERRQLDVKVQLDGRLQPKPHRGELLYNKGAHYYWVTGTSLRKLAKGKWFMGWRHSPEEGLVLLLRSPKDPNIKAAEAEGVPLVKESGPWTGIERGLGLVGSDTGGLESGGAGGDRSTRDADMTPASGDERPFPGAEGPSSLGPPGRPADGPLVGPARLAAFAGAAAPKREPQEDGSAAAGGTRSGPHASVSLGALGARASGMARQPEQQHRSHEHLLGDAAEESRGPPASSSGRFALGPPIPGRTRPTGGGTGGAAGVSDDGSRPRPSQLLTVPEGQTVSSLQGASLERLLALPELRGALAGLSAAAGGGGSGGAQRRAASGPPLAGVPLADRLLSARATAETALSLGGGEPRGGASSYAAAAAAGEEELEALAAGSLSDGRGGGSRLPLSLLLQLLAERRQGLLGAEAAEPQQPLGSQQTLGGGGGGGGGGLGGRRALSAQHAQHVQPRGREAALLEPAERDAWAGQPGAGGGPSSAAAAAGRLPPRALAVPSQSRGSGQALLPPILMPASMAALLPADQLPAVVALRVQVDGGPLDRDAIECEVRAAGGDVRLLHNVPSRIFADREVASWGVLEDGSLLLRMQTVAPDDVEMDETQPALLGPPFRQREGGAGEASRRLLGALLASAGGGERSAPNGFSSAPDLAAEDLGLGLGLGLDALQARMAQRRPASSTVEHDLASALAGGGRRPWSGSDSVARTLGVPPPPLGQPAARQPGGGGSLGPSQAASLRPYGNRLDGPGTADWRLGSGDDAAHGPEQR